MPWAHVRKVNGDRGRIQLPNVISAPKLSKSVLALVIPPGSRRFGHPANLQIEVSGVSGGKQAALGC